MQSRLTDNQAKQVLARWPLRPRGEFFPGGPWLRAQPIDGVTAGPRLIRPVTHDFTARTQPDGLWLAFNAAGRDGFPDSVAVFAIEVCQTMQNLNDKRSRFAAAHAALLVDVQRAWLAHGIPVEGGAKRARSDVAGFDSVPAEDILVPVSSVRVLYALPNDKRLNPAQSKLFNREKRRVALEAHEYLTRHSALTPNNKGTRLLVRSALSSHVA